MNAFRFESPVILLLLLPVLGISVFATTRRRATVLYSSIALLKDLPVTSRQRIRRMLPWIQLLGFVLIVVALARPQFGREETRISTEGIAVQMCIDRSGSMQALDFPVDGEQVDRLTAVKKVFREFVTGEGGFSGRRDDLIGLIAFGGFASALCPPTLDHGALLEILASVKIPEPIRDDEGNVLNAAMLREEQATAIGDALALAVDRLRNIDTKSKVIVLLSDGENTAGVVAPEDAAATAAEFGIKVYSIGVGSNGMAPYKVVDPFGREFLQSRPVRLDEATLRSIADKTDGLYFNAQDTAALEQVYEQIDALEKTEIEGRLYTEYREVFGYPMCGGLSCVLLSVILGSTWLRGLP